jgi:hypothetical protein
MPFTLAHPAAVLPLPRLMGRAGILSALVIGSIAPDLPYFLGDPLQRKTTHSLHSLLWFSLPAGWAVYLAFELAMRRALVFVLPRAFRARLRSTPQLGEYGPVTACILIGALTHLAWDAITHELGSYAVLQVMSTLIGLAAIAGVTARWLQRSAPRPLPPTNRALEYRRFVARLLVVATFLCMSPVAALWIHMTHPGGASHPVVTGGHALLTGLGFSAALLACGGVWLERGGLKT